MDEPGDQRETGRIGLELPQRVGRIGDHLARLLEEDVAHLVIVLQAGRREGRRLGQRRRKRWRARGLKARSDSQTSSQMPATNDDR